MEKIKKFVVNLASLQGSAHYIAVGVASGVFVSVTPTIPFHTAIAVFVALILHGSKRAAMISVWFSNPVTIPVFYAGSYYTGVAALDIKHSNIEIVFNLLHTLESHITLSEKMDSILLFLKAELPLFYAMMIGGLILAVVPGVASYFITFYSVKKFRQSKKADNQDSHDLTDKESKNDLSV